MIFGLLPLLWTGIKSVAPAFVSWITGGALDKILSTIDKRMSDEVEKDRIKAEVTKTYAQAQANLLVGRTWWFQLFFVIPLGLWWTAVILDSVWFHTNSVKALPPPLDDWAAWIISALFLVDGSKAIIGRWRK